MRRTGETIRQIINAPLNSVFIWPVRNSINYVKDLCKINNREDLKIETIEWLENKKWRGCEFTGIVIDRSIVLNERQHECFKEFLTRIR